MNSSSSFQQFWNDLVEFMKEPKAALVRIEVVVIFTTFLFGFLGLVGSYRRNTRSGWLSVSLFGVYTAAPSLVSYLLGKMRHAPNDILKKLPKGINSEMFFDFHIVTWATFLLIICTLCDNLNAFSLQDNENQHRHTVQFLVFTSFYVVLIVQCLKSIVELQILWLLWIFVFLKVKERQHACRYATRHGVAKTGKDFVDFMRYERTLSTENDPATLRGYKYLVKVEKKHCSCIGPFYQSEIDLRKAVTVENIWHCEGKLLNSSGDPDGRLKDLCLSISLFWLLLCRYGDYPLYESKQDKEKAWRLVWNGLLREDAANHERVFRVIEVELKFLHDYFYTKYYATYAEPRQFLKRFFLLALVIGFSSYYFWETIPYDDLSVENYCTYIMIIVLLIVELVQLGFLFTSEWCKVKFICYYVQKQLWKTKKGRFLGEIIQILCQKSNSKPWGRRLGQYCLLQSYDYNPVIYRLARCCIGELVEIPRPGQKCSSTEFSTDVREALLSSLLLNGQRLFNGVAALRRNEVCDEVPLNACELETCTHVILVWHIATSLCEMAYSHDPNKLQALTDLKDFRVAKHLSMYCAYLVAFAPKLLPDGQYITKFVFDKVIKEARKFFKEGRYRIWKKVNPYEKLMKSRDIEFSQAKSNLERGVVLAKDLMSRIPDENKRWKVLAEFWAEMLLFLAPSNNVMGHADHLAKGGELITHLWALLTHAGILERHCDDLVDVEIN